LLEYDTGNKKYKKVDYKKISNTEKEEDNMHGYSYTTNSIAHIFGKRITADLLEKMLDEREHGDQGEYI